MSAIPKDAADIPTAFPHPTGAATVINSNSVNSNFTFTSNLTDFAFLPSAFSSASTSWSSSFAAAAASASPSRPESRDSQLPSPRDFSVEQHQAEYRGQAYLANESTVATIQAAGTYLQKIFTNGTDVNKDILRAASAASRARLQNPFAYNNSRSSSGSSGSSGPSGSSGSSRQSAKQAKHDATEAFLAEGRLEIFGFPDPELDKIPSPIPPYKLDHSLAPYRSDANKTDLAFLDHLNKQREAACPENIRAAEEANRAAKNTAPRGTAIPGGLPCDSTTPATPSATAAPSTPASDPADSTDDSPAVLAKIGPGSTLATIAAAQRNAVETVAAPAPEAASDLAISPCEPISPAAPEAPAAPTEAEFQELEKRLTALSGRPFTIGRSAKIHDPAVVAYFEDHALYIQNQISMARFREACINADSRSRWPHGP